MLGFILLIMVITLIIVVILGAILYQVGYILYDIIKLFIVDPIVEMVKNKSKEKQNKK